MVLTPNSNIFGCCPSCQFPGAGGGEENDNNAPCQSPNNCLPDGRFAAVQCKGDMFKGRCFCSDENGNRIFGQMWRNEASDMTCACSRRRHELEATGRSVTLHCTANGDYEPLQCDDGLCWCADPGSGQPTVTPVPQADMKLLPCYSAATVGENYLRRCESLTHALATMYKEQRDHGTTFFGSPTTFCDYDGSFGSYQIQNGIAYCTGRDGSILGSWQAETSVMGDMNCNCARDTMIYFPERSMSVTAVCQANGNYRPNQVAGDIRYCLDSDGYSIPEEDWPAACTYAQ
ncbi:uncharacterized protein LOC121739287 isoform X2 [Aricia agestis]|nr:uncharacterized protein LOC121739287 isoform X2 [Aricia agestis]